MAGSTDGPPGGPRSAFSSSRTFHRAPSKDWGWPPATLRDSSSTPASGTRRPNVKSRLFDRCVPRPYLQSGLDTAHCASLFRGPVQRCVTMLRTRWHATEASDPARPCGGTVGVAPWAHHAPCPTPPPAATPHVQGWRRPGRLSLEREQVTWPPHEPQLPERLHDSSKAVV